MYVRMYIENQGIIFAFQTQIKYYVGTPYR